MVRFIYEFNMEQKEEMFRLDIIRLQNLIGWAQKNKKEWKKKEEKLDKRFNFRWVFGHFTGLANWKKRFDAPEVLRL